MHQQHTRPPLAEEKLSDEFRRRLLLEEPDKRVYALVLLKTNSAHGARGRQRNREDAIRAVRSAASSAMASVALVLERFGGRWLAEEPDAIGSIPIEATAAGVIALAQSEHVKAIMENQRVRSVQRPKR